MKLQKLPSRKSGDKTYYKFMICLSPKKVAELDWLPGDELEDMVKNGKLVLESASLRARKKVVRDTQ